MSLQTDAAGRILLGRLAGIVSLSASAPGVEDAFWALTGDVCRYPPLIHARVGDTVSIPYMGTGTGPKAGGTPRLVTDAGLGRLPRPKDLHEHFSLLEKRGATYVADHIKAIELKDGCLKIQGMPAGEYDLLLKEPGVHVVLRLVDAQPRDGWLAGRSCLLETRNPAPLQITRVAVEKDALTISLGNSTADTRVHVYATRFVPAFSVFGELGRLGIMATNRLSAVYREVFLPEVKSRPRDLRLVLNLDPEKQLTEKCRVTALEAGSILVVQDITTSKVESYDTLGRLYALYATLSDDSFLETFSFIHRWPDIEHDEKCALYSEHACHELNFFLYKKDPDFFTAVTEPYLRNKKDKTFLDHYLIGDNLEPFLEPWAFGRLNVVERILLSERIEGRLEPGTRHVNDLYELLPDDTEHRSYLFRTAVQGSALDTHDVLGLDAASASAIAARQENAASPDGLQALFAEANDMADGAGAMAPPASEPEMEEDELEDMQEEELDEAPEEEWDEHEGDLAKRREMKCYYWTLDKTLEWSENNYYRLSASEQKADLVTVNAFWRDYARRDRGKPFLSPHIAEATRNFTEMMPAQPAAEPPPVLLSQNYFREDDRYRYENGQPVDKYVSDEFLIRTTYICQVVLTNPTSSEQKLDLLLQIPRGAVAVNNGFTTRGLPVCLASFSTHTVEYGFYFPAPDSFPHYPALVAKNEQSVTAAAASTLEVVSRLSRMDTGSWPHLSQYGGEQEVLGFLEGVNIERLDLDKIA